MNSIKNKMISSIYGFIIGDALGVPIEGASRDALRKIPVLDMTENKSRRTCRGYWSDDTAMTLCTMKSIIDKKCIDYKDMLDKFLIWYRDGYMSCEAKCYGIGQRTLKALSFYYSEIGNPSVTKSLGDNWIVMNGKLSMKKTEKECFDNGALMRMLPVILYLYNLDINIREKIRIIENCAYLTHCSNYSTISCTYYMLFVFSVMDGNKIVEAIRKTNKQITNYYTIDDSSDFIRIISMKFWALKSDSIRSSSNVVDTLQAVLWCLANSKTFEDAVLKAINLGGDTDTIGALVGGVAGIYYDASEIPTIWVNDLLKKDIIKDISLKFVELC